MIQQQQQQTSQWVLTLVQFNLVILLNRDATTKQKQLVLTQLKLT